MKQKQLSFKNKIMVLSIGLFYASIPAAFAALPQAPDIEGAAQGDYLKVANQLGLTMIGYLIPLVYAVSGFTYCGGMLYLFNQAKEKEEWGGFFKAGIIGLGLLVLILYLLNTIKKAI